MAKGNQQAKGNFLSQDLDIFGSSTDDEGDLNLDSSIFNDIESDEPKPTEPETKTEPEVKDEPASETETTEEKPAEPEATVHAEPVTGNTPEQDDAELMKWIDDLLATSKTEESKVEEIKAEADKSGDTKLQGLVDELQ